MLCAEGGAPKQRGVKDPQRAPWDAGKQARIAAREEGLSKSTQDAQVAEAEERMAATGTVYLH